VALLIRQTARYPIAALADGTAFRNSILAGFEDAAWPRELLLVLLNSSLLRFAHYWRHRDAREGMPQLKVGHLRALPALPSRARRERADLLELGATLRSEPLTDARRARLDALVGQAFSLSRREQAAVQSWALSHPPPAARAPRKRTPEPAARAAADGPGT
jgi:hypothetical protein